MNIKHACSQFTEYEKGRHPLYSLEQHISAQSLPFPLLFRCHCFILHNTCKTVEVSDVEVGGNIG